MPTERIYQKDRYKTANTAEITAVREINGFDTFTCTSSVFYPLGGGQPSDVGTVTLDDKTYNVVSASDTSLESDVWHLTDAPAGTFHVGDSISLAINWNIRFQHMQRHLGEHMLSGTMHSLFGGVNKGFHMGEEYITIDIDLGGRMLTESELDLAEHKVNEAIWANLPVTVSCFDDYESSLVLPVRKKVPHDGKVYVVTVGDLSDPYDCIACCGTHPATSSEVGLLAIYKCEPNKGMNRIFFDCGSMAFAKLSSDSQLLSAIAAKYSCSSWDLLRRLDAETETIAALKSRISSLSAYVKDIERTRILEDMTLSVSDVYTYTTDILSIDELLKLGFSVIGETNGQVLLMLHPESLTCLVFSSGEVKCGKLIKEHAGEFGGRGGGRDDNARAIFKTAKDMHDFASAVEKMLQ